MFTCVLPGFADVCAEAVGDNVADEDEQQHAHRDGVGHLVVALLGIGEGQIGHGLGVLIHHNDDEVQLLGNADEGEHEAGDKAVFGQGQDNLSHALPEIGAVDVGGLLQLHRDLHHVGGTGPAGEGEVLDHAGQDDEGEGAVQGGDQPAQAGLGEHGYVHGGISQTIMQDYFTMIMMVSISANSDVTKLGNILTKAGEELGVTIRVQHEDIFNAMHKL